MMAVAIELIAILDTAMMTVVGWSCHSRVLLDKLGEKVLRLAGRSWSKRANLSDG